MKTVSKASMGRESSAKGTGSWAGTHDVKIKKKVTIQMARFFVFIQLPFEVFVSSLSEDAIPLEDGIPGKSGFYFP